jgi:hypothetical protein
VRQRSEVRGHSKVSPSRVLEAYMATAKTNVYVLAVRALSSGACLRASVRALLPTWTLLSRAPDSPFSHVGSSLNHLSESLPYSPGSSNINHLSDFLPLTAP